MFQSQRHRLQGGKALCQNGGIRKGCSRKRMVTTTAFSTVTEQCQMARRDPCSHESVSGRLEKCPSFPLDENTIDCATWSTGSAVLFPPLHRAKRLGRSQKRT